jgi:hypothetical protein
MAVPKLTIAVAAIGSLSLSLSIDAATVEGTQYKQEKVSISILRSDVVGTTPALESLLDVANTSIGHLFHSLKDEWFGDPKLMFSSATEDFINSDSFRNLVNIGTDIYPYILEDLTPDTALRWDLVLTSIHGGSVVPEREWGNADKVVSRWSKFLKREPRATRFAIQC